MLALLPFAHIRDARINESSGLAPVRGRPGAYWTHNDSGDTARLFMIDLTGRLLEERPIPNATNADWEDVATDGDTIWIDDAGNNGNARRDLCLYAVPARGGSAVRYPIVYPDQTAFPPERDRRFDCEAIFPRKGRMYLITKWRVGKYLPGSGAALYRMDTRRADRPNVLTRLDERTDLGGWVTSASLSPDGKELAVLVGLVSPAIWIFDATRGEKLLSYPKARLAIPGTGQAESLVWESPRSLVFGNEAGELYRAARSGFATVGE